jgi:vacuolar-type H+-ATPase subunit I/STV1
MAGKTGSPRMAEIRSLQKDYNDKYEKLAEPHYAEINEAATQLAEERRYDDALRKIDAFPQHLRLSRSWINLDKLRQDIERRKKEAAPKKK